MMFKQKGFTLIELMIAIAFVLILASLFAGAVGGVRDGNVTMGINGVTESRCIEGYKFIVDQQGNARQILDEFGKGAKCNKGGM